jgi:REP element-mobilizing transposase RayT
MVGKYNSEKHRRRSIRLQGYDYSRQGAYFVTICAQERQCLFGETKNGEMRLNEIGDMVQYVWKELPVKYSGIDIDEFIVMPNHVHGIILLPAPVGAGPRACPVCDSKAGNGLSDKQPEKNRPYKQGNHGGIAPTLSLSDVVHRFKSFTTATYRTCVMKLNWSPFPGTLWQRNYYERIIRNEDELNRIRQYILNNPQQWDYDENNPANLKDFSKPVDM